MLSVIIPSRSPEFLQKTVEECLTKAKHDVEVVVVFDGIPPPSDLKSDPRVIVLTHGELTKNKGMRESINYGVAQSHGDHLMKIDEHCMMDQDYEEKLYADCEDNWVCIPRRYRLAWESWSVLHDRRCPVDYMFLAYPFQFAYDKASGLHGAEWKERYDARKDILIDDTMSWQGSCWFMSRKHWDWLGPLETEKYGPFTQEAQEIGNKTWLGGGRLIVNKKTWYAHYHKGNRGKRYGFTNWMYKVHQDNMEKGREFCVDYWLGNQWEGRIHDFSWLIEKFSPVPTWPDNWQQAIEDEKILDYRYIRPGGPVTQYTPL